MKWAYSVSSYAKLYEKYCKENLPSEADDIFKKADEYYREHGDEDDEDNLATDDEMAYSSGNPAPKESTYDEVGSEMSSPKTSHTDTYTAVVLALLFGSVASVAVYKLKK